MPSAFTPVITAKVWSEYPDYRALSITVRGFRPVAGPLLTGPLTPPDWMEAHLESWRVAVPQIWSQSQKDSQFR